MKNFIFVYGSLLVVMSGFISWYWSGGELSPVVSCPPRTTVSIENSILPPPPHPRQVNPLEEKKYDSVNILPLVLIVIPNFPITSKWRIYTIVLVTMHYWETNLNMHLQLLALMHQSGYPKYFSEKWWQRWDHGCDPKQSITPVDLLIISMDWDLVPLHFKIVIVSVKRVSNRKFQCVVEDNNVIICIRSCFMIIILII